MKLSFWGSRIQNTSVSPSHACERPHARAHARAYTHTHSYARTHALTRPEHTHTLTHTRTHAENERVLAITPRRFRGPFKSKPIAATKRWHDCTLGKTTLPSFLVRLFCPSCIDRGVGSGGDGLGGGSASNDSGCQ